MNIFKALSQGDGSINDTNVTSFMSYIFNETNDFSSSFLLLFLELVENQIDDFEFQSIPKYNGKNHRQRINDFTSRYTYSAIPAEYRVKRDNITQDVDILLNIIEKETDNDCCYFLIEKKIKKSALKEKQCTEQYKLFKSIEDFQEDVHIFSVLISPDFPNFLPMIENVRKFNPFSIWLKWETESGDSIIDIFRKLISLESNSEIPPIDNNALYIIKSFIDYISTELSTKEKSLNFSVAGSQVVEQAEFILDKKRYYYLKRFDNIMIRIYDANNELTDKTVKPILRRIINEYKLDVDLERKLGKRKNTQTHGKDVIRRLYSFRFR